jgi:hypothetical protein
MTLIKKMSFMKTSTDYEITFFTAAEQELFDRCLYYQEKMQPKKEANSEDTDYKYTILLLENIILRLQKIAMTREIIYRMETEEEQTIETDNDCGCEKCGSRDFMEIVGEEKNEDGFMCNIMHCTDCDTTMLSHFPNNWPDYYQNKLLWEDQVKSRLDNDPELGDINKSDQEKILKMLGSFAKGMIKREKTKNDYKKESQLAEEIFTELNSQLKESEIILFQKFGIYMS